MWEKHLVIKHKCKISFQHFEFVKLSVFLIFISQNASVEGALKWKSTFGRRVGIVFPQACAAPQRRRPCLSWVDVFEGTWLCNNFPQCEFHFLTDSRHKTGNAFLRIISPTFWWGRLSNSRQRQSVRGASAHRRLCSSWELRFSVFVLTLYS